MQHTIDHFIVVISFACLLPTNSIVHDLCHTVGCEMLCIEMP